MSQHGIAGGYYLAFFFGGFVTTVGRLCRANLRPLFLEATPAPPKGAVGAKAPQPRALPLKPIYDLLGTLCTVMMTNYAATPFMLLGIRRSLQAWSVLGWYGHVMIFGAMAFFYGGGSSVLKGIQIKRIKKAEKLSGHATNGTSTPGTPGQFTMPPVDIALQEVELKLK